jgi:hypothetical protein
VWGTLTSSTLGGRSGCEVETSMVCRWWRLAIELWVGLARDDGANLMRGEASLPRLLLLRRAPAPLLPVLAPGRNWKPH